VVRLADITQACFGANKTLGQIPTDRGVHQRIGLVEPPVVERSCDTGSKFFLLDGHLRLEVLGDRGLLEVECLVSTEDETFTYNNRVNRIAIIQVYALAGGRDAAQSIGDRLHAAQT
jgi:hypothetical protein